MGRAGGARAHNAGGARARPTRPWIPPPDGSGASPGAVAPWPSVRAPSARFRLLVGGTAPADVAALRAALAQRLARRGLLPPQGGPAGPPPGAPVRARCTALPLLVPIGPQEDPEQVDADLQRRAHRLNAAADLIVRTSGSTTGTGRLVAMGAGALVASARATHARLGGPGTWVLALPAHHVAGLQILTRSLLAGTEPVVVDTRTGFDPARLAEAVLTALAVGAGGRDGAVRAGRGPHGHGRLGPDSAQVGPGSRLYVSLVPTQLQRVLDDSAATKALARAETVLLGGASAPPGLLKRSSAAGIRVVTTYGMSETGGGCIYDGLPLDGVRVRVNAHGRVVLCGPVLAEGYADDGPQASAQGNGENRALEDARSGGAPSGPGRLAPAGVSSAPGFHTERGPDGLLHRVLVTADRGRMEADGRLTVLGRVDDIIVTGGVKVDPHQVEAALIGLDDVVEACVVGVPDPQWGRAVVAAVVLKAGANPDPAALRAAARTLLDGPSCPKKVIALDALPVRGPGKPDRRAVQTMLQDAPGRPGEEGGS